LLKINGCDKMVKNIFSKNFQKMNNNKSKIAMGKYFCNLDFLILFLTQSPPQAGRIKRVGSLNF